MSLVLKANSEISASIPKENIPRHPACEAEELKSYRASGSGWGVGAGSAQPQGAG